MRIVPPLHILSFLLPLIQEGQLSVTGESMCTKYWLGGLSLPRKSVVRLTDCPAMTLGVYDGRKTTTQQQQHIPLLLDTQLKNLLHGQRTAFIRKLFHILSSYCMRTALHKVA